MTIGILFLAAVISLLMILIGIIVKYKRDISLFPTMKTLGGKDQ